MIRHKLLLTALMSLWVVPLVGHAKTTTWLTEPLQIDGLFNDWLQYPRAYLEDIGTSYGMVNDGEYLYILVQRQGAMGPGGGQVRIWLNTENKKKKTFGFLLQGPHPEINVQRSQQNQDQSQQRQQMRERTGGPNLAEGLYMLQSEEADPVLVHCADDSPIQMKTSALETGVTFYEVRIPLNGAPGQDVMFTMDPGQRFRIGFEAMPKMSGPGDGSGPPSGGMGGGRGGMGGGRSGGMGGGPPGGGRGGGPGMNRGSMEPETVWLKYKLAEQDD